MLAVLTALILMVTPAYQENSSVAVTACKRPSSWKIHYQLAVEYPKFKRALVIHFGRSWKEAAIVSWGEGSWHWWAENGQFKGTFQMGSDEREQYGHGNTLVAQVKAAARYWRESGRDWSPWTCKP